jgi:hypothetical protein
MTTTDTPVKKTVGGSWRYVKAPTRTSITQQDRGRWAESVKLKAFAFHTACGSRVQTCREFNLPKDTLNTWMKSEWWKDQARAVQNEDHEKMDVKLTKALDKALDEVMDRIENGEYIFDPKTGKTKVVPAKLRDLNVAFNSLIDKRQLIRKQPTKIIEQQTTAAQLQNLADQFAQFVTGKTKQEKFNDLVEDVIEGETVVQNEDGTWEVKET